MNSLWNRRLFFKTGTAALFSMVTPAGFLPKALASTCGLTPPQTPGPFYPGEASFMLENDLTTLPGSDKRALGQVIYVSGLVEDVLCRPVPSVLVEIWQACASGRYNNPTDTNSAPLDPNFRYWGETVTDANGHYQFKTILPGAYPADTDWIRPPHIHFRVTKVGYKELVTQMYFAGNELNKKDQILDGVPHDEWDRVIVDFKPAGSGFEPSSLAGKFNLSIQKVRG